MGAMTVAIGQGSRSRRTRAQVRRDILQAASIAFAELGYDDATLDDVAHRAGTTRKGVLYQFRSKEELLEALVAAFFSDLDDLLDRTPTEDAPTTWQRRETIGAILEAFSRHRAAAELLVRFQNIVPALELGPAVTRYNADLARRLGGTAIDEDADLKLRVTVAMATIRGLLAGRRDVDITDAEQRRRLVELIHGLVDDETALAKAS